MLNPFARRHPNVRHNATAFSGSREGCVVGFIIVAVFTLAIVSIGFGAVSAFHTSTYSACVVNDKDRATNHDGKSSMRIYTDNCGTFTVKDSILSGRFDSADDYSRIKVGKTYDFNTRGWRVPIVSAFPNIVEVKESSK